MNKQEVLNKFDEAISNGAIIVIQYKDPDTDKLECHGIKPGYELVGEDLYISLIDSKVRKLLPLTV